MPKIKYAILFIAIIINTMNVFLNSNTLINNNPGRVIELEFDSYARDNNGKYVFKDPRHILATPDNNYFVIDNGQVFMFAKDGMYLKTIVSKGQAPTEATHLNQLFSRNDDMIVNTGFMGKLIFFDFSGHFKKEYKLQLKMRQFLKDGAISESSFQIISATQNDDLYIKSNAPSLGVSPSDNGFIYEKVMLLSLKNQSLKKCFEIPLKSVSCDTPLGKCAIAECNTIWSSNREYIYFCNTDGYEIKRFNVIKNQMEGVIKKDFKQVIIQEKDKKNYQIGNTIMADYNGKSSTYAPPSRKYYRDIQALIATYNSLWVITSTVDKNKGVLVDIFNLKGINIDSFYLSFNPTLNLNAIFQSHICICNNFLIIKETDEDDEYMIIKYRIPANAL